MKSLVTSVIVLAAIFALCAQLQSQTPGVPKTPLEQLQAMKLKNQEILEKQAETLKKLGEMELQSDQIKAFAKRT